MANTSSPSPFTEWRETRVPVVYVAQTEVFKIKAIFADAGHYRPTSSVMLLNFLLDSCCWRPTLVGLSWECCELPRERFPTH